MFSALSFPARTATPRLIGALCATCALMGADRAEAGMLVASAADCDQQVLEQPFLPWADPARYTLVPNGSFAEGGRSWQLSGAGVVSENEPFRVRGDHRPASVRVEAGGSATSPALCVGIAHPTLRFFARNDGPVTSTLAVEALFEDSTGSLQSLLLGEVAGHSAWEPTLPLPLVANLLTLLPNERTPVAFRFSVAGGAGGAWLVDDVYVDPYSKG